MSSPECDAAIVETFTNARGVAVTRILDIIAGCFLVAVAVLLIANTAQSSAPGAFVAGSVALIAIAALLFVHAMRLRAIVLCCYAERFTIEGMPREHATITCQWSEVSEVMIALTAGGARSPRFPYLELTTPTGTLLGPPAKDLVSERLVRRVNLMTPHLPYSWERKSSQWTHLLWEKVPRGSRGAII